MKKLIVLLAIAAGALCWCATGLNNVSAEQVSAQIGDTVVADNFDLSMLSAQSCHEFVNGLGTRFTAGEGTEYLIVVLDAKNTTDETRNIMNTNLNGCIDGERTTIEPIGGEVGGYMPLLGAVPAGCSFEGYAIWLVPDGWTNLTFSYIDALTGAESGEFAVYRANIA